MDQTKFSGCLRMKYLIAIALLMLTGCEERYRYFCQNPDNFTAEQCQKPKCLFTQHCPEYLVAPILQKQVENVQPPQDDKK
jgi:hypothetical protein